MQLRMPKLSASMKEGLIVAWLKRPGDAVKKGEALLQVETDKAVCEVEAPANGVLRLILQQTGAKVAVETPIAEIE